MGGEQPVRTAMLVVSAVVVVLFLAAGVAGVATRWTLPRNRGRVLRPRLAGCGALLSAAGYGLFMFLGPLRGPGTRFAWVAWVGWLMFMAGCGVQWLSTRPGRSRPTPASS
ncbi:hypothetical protein ACIQU5_00670 [Streptomyces sp. NPDC090306]|uniref:hypothetical protein n=1 Tax=Streptomyces sp. NPDC090306 TaxID=3365961 RepID=UPI0038269F18